MHYQIREKFWKIAGGVPNLLSTRKKISNRILWLVKIFRVSLLLHHGINKLFFRVKMSNYQKKKIIIITKHGKIERKQNEK